MAMIVMIAWLIIDQATKIGVQKGLIEHMEVIPGYFYITYVKNDGAAWSILAGKTYLLILIAIVALIVLGRLLWMAHVKKQRMMEFALASMLAGALGNLIDRLQFGYVRDFMEWYPFGYHFPIFNIADVALTLGVILLLIISLRMEKEESRHGN